MGIRVGVDVGGTFTDVVAVDTRSGEVFRVKVLSTPRDPVRGVVEGLRRVLERVSPGEVEVVVHATTLGTNLFLGQVGLEPPKTALVTTRGFRDVLEIGRQRRPELYNVFFEKPRPLVPRRLRFTVDERVGPDGRVVKPLSLDEARRVARLVRREGCEAVAICLLHSYANPVHEEMLRRVFEEECPGVFVVASYEVDPEYREYERMSTTVVNAVLKPLFARYLGRLVEELRRLGLKAKVLIMKSDGGFCTCEEAVRVPAATIESGPAAGVVAAAYLARLLGIGNALSLDMGGTTAKAAAIVGFKPLMTSEFEVGGRVHKGRVVKGSGYVVRYPHIDLAEVSAGGGTIAWVDEGGALRVGPYSAGSDPGPACYGRGGVEPTVTDANLVLGRLGRVLAGGEIVLNVSLAVKAFKERICSVTGLDLVEAAYGVLKLVNTEMARAIRIVTIERGFDPRDFTLIAFGGAGPMHACELAEEMGIGKVIVPREPGVFSALGLLLADYRHELKRSVLKPAEALDASELEEIFQELEERGYKILESEGVEKSRVVTIRYVDARYARQAWELTIEAPKPVSSIEEIVARFHEKHEMVYGYSMPEEEVMVVNARVTVVGIVDKPRFAETHVEKLVDAPASTVKEVREVFFPKEGWVKTPVVDRAKLKPGYVVEGPAVIEEYDSTTVVPPGWVCRVDSYGNLVLEHV